MIAKAKNAITPISSTLKGKLNIPVPIAPASRVKVAPLREPSVMGPKARLKHDLLSGYAESTDCVIRD